MGVVLGNGRFYAPRAGSPMTTETYGYPKLLLQLRLEFEDGSVSEVTSDTSWKLTTAGPIVANNEYDGEDYDARKELPGWSTPGFEDSAWQPARRVSPPGGQLSAEMAEPIRVTATLKPLSVHEVTPGVFIFDLGQNMVGWCRLRVRGPAGTMVSLRHAERLQEDGTLYMDNLRGARVTDHYTLKGTGTEVYEPRFTYHGFRFVEVTGYPGKPTVADLEGRVVNDDLPTAGTFVTSQPVLNRNYTNIVWGTRGNYRSIPTDCPQRDERQGWLGDRSAEARGETLIFDTAAFYSKWLRDIADAQKENGSISDVCPTYWPLYNDNVTWPASAVIIPGALVDHYADTALIVRHYPAMSKWIEHMTTYVKDGIIEKDNYGDWCVPPEDPKLIHSNDPKRKTSAAILATSYFIHCLDQMTSYAQLLGKPEDQERFAKAAGEMKRVFNERFYNQALGYYDNGTQTACVLPLAFDLVPESERGRVFERLVTKITEETKGHVGTGLIGGQWLNRVLTAGGRADLSYGFATNCSYPSWGYMADKGATTIWELWNGDTADPAMNSGNHVMLVGDLVIWFYENLAGIKADPQHPGFKHILMKPEPVGGLQWVNASYRSPYGKIVSEWRKAAGEFQWSISVPPNTTATVYFPTATTASVRESGRNLDRVKGVKFLRTEPGRAVYSLTSGSYKFTAR
jgi:alpha-L-rhamnosidase